MAKTPIQQAKNPDQGDLIEKIEITAGSEQIENDTPIVEEVSEEEPEVEVEDASIALQKQVDALKKSEGIHKDRAERFRQESERNQQLAQTRATEVEKTRKEAFQSQADAISTALGAAQSEAESAKRDIKTAINNGDVDAQADAYERLATARANISKLEDGKFEIEARIKNPPVQEEKPVTQQQNALPQRMQRWLQKNPQYLTDPRKNDRIRSLHWEVMDEGHDFDSDDYIESMETKLGMREETNEEQPVVIQRQPQQKTSIVSAPVSREAPSTPTTGRNDGQIKLTVAQREAAKIAGVTEKVYAEQLQKISKMKANGSYQVQGDRS